MERKQVRFSGEAIVIPNRSLSEDFDFHLKQRGALLAKGRALGLQFRLLFGDGLFERAAQTSNELARTLADGITAAGFTLAAETESNQVFAVLPDSLIAQLSESYRFSTWEPRPNDESVVRLVTSWATDASQVERFVSMLAD